MAVLSPQPKMQFTTAAGVPLSGGKLYTYIAGTTTPQATFTDSTNATPNTNPVVLDSRGEANIWLGAATYKFKLTDANDVEIWTVDYISAPTSGISPVLSGNVVIDSDTPGPALKITQTGTGPVLRVQDSTDPDTTPFIIDTSGNLGLGTPTPTAQLEATGAAKIGSLTLTSSPLPVASGGTGLATLTANNVLIGAGTSNVTFVAPGTSGNILTSNGTVWSSQPPAAVNTSGRLLNVQVFTSSGTYTRTANVTQAVVIAVGGGGGGGGSSGAGGTGGTTSFGAHVSAAGGSGGLTDRTGGLGGTGGTGATIAIRGQAGASGAGQGTVSGGAGGVGGGQGGGTGARGGGGTAGVRGGGGGGAQLHDPCVSGIQVSCGGGGQGETAIDYITSGLNATETVTIGAGGTAGSGGASIAVGGAGGAGYVIVYEYL